MIEVANGLVAGFSDSVICIGHWTGCTCDDRGWEKGGNERVNQRRIHNGNVSHESQAVKGRWIVGVKERLFKRWDWEMEKEIFRERWIMEREREREREGARDRDGGRDRERARWSLERERWRARERAWKSNRERERIDTNLYWLIKLQYCNNL